MKNKMAILEDFNSLFEYLRKEGKINDLNSYKKDFSAFLLHANHIKAYDFAAPLCKGKRVLDVGCFIGYGEKVLADCAKEVIAIDSDDKALEFAARNVFGTHIKFEKVNAERLPFYDESFDITIAFQLIEHIPPKQVNKFLCEAKRVLKKGGLLFITTPNRKFRLLPFQRPFNPEHYQEFTAKRLFKTLKVFFDEVQIKAVRARGWIEEIERRRVRKSLYRAYIRTPAIGFLKVVCPARIKRLLKKYKRKKIKSSQRDVVMSEYSSEFDKLFQKFSMDVFFLEERMLDKSMSLFAICKK